MQERDQNDRLHYVEAFDKAHVCCVGDVMLDRFIYGEVSRISPEAPIPVMKRSHEKVMLGGAGNVVRNLLSLGANCCFISVIGDDATGHTLTRLIGEQERLEPYLITDASRRSTEKSRYVCGMQQLLRCDDEDTRPLSRAAEDKLLALLAQSLPQYPLLLLSDYAKGVLTDRVIQESITLAQAHGIPVFIDPKRADISLYKGATLLSPNLKEIQQFVPDLNVQSNNAIHAAAQQLCTTYGFEAMTVTRGKEGLSLISSDSAIDIPAQALEVYDVSGAGDTVIATLAAAYASGAPLEVAAALANLAAGIAVSRAGTAAVYRTDLKAALHHEALLASHSKLVSADMASAMVASWQQEGLKVGFTNGCFDVLHRGHLQSLQQAKSHCDRLIVAINSDASVRRLKGETRPINREMDRADLIAGLSCVDLVVIFREDTPLSLLDKLKPNLLMKGADYTKEQVVGREIVEAYGGEIILLPLIEGYSSTQTIAKIQNFV